MGVLTGLTRTLSRWIYHVAYEQAICLTPNSTMTYLLTIFGIEQEPANFDDLGGVFGYVDAMFVASGSNMNNQVAVNIRLCPLSA